MKIFGRNLFPTLLCLLITPNTCWAADEGALTFSGEGNGSETSPYVIRDVTQLQEMRFDLDAYYVLGYDIDAIETQDWNGGEGFEPIGATGAPFKGVFDGKRYTIHNFHINRPEQSMVGLFGETSEATIKNVRLRGGSIAGYNRVGSFAGSLIRSEMSFCDSSCSVSGNDNVGGIYGYGEGDRRQYYIDRKGVKSYYEEVVSGTVEKCFGRGDVIATGERVGGIAGVNDLFMTLVDCESHGSVVGTGRVGGMIGYNSAECPVTSCFATGDVFGTGARVGGLIGQNFRSDVSDSYATGAVFSQGAYVGGLIGRNDQSSIFRCYASGDVSAPDQVGGLIGATDDGRLTHSFAVGNVIGDGRLYGGLVGGNRGVIDRCFATGNVSGYEGIGGLVGYSGRPTHFVEGNHIRNCYALGAVSGYRIVGGLVGSVDGPSPLSSFSACSVSGRKGVGGIVGGERYDNSTFCFWDVDASGRHPPDHSPPGSAKTSAEMKKQETFWWWDFDTVWTINESKGYPILRGVPQISDIDLGFTSNLDVVHSEGEEVRYNIAVRNLSMIDLRNVAIRSWIPPELSIQSAAGDLRSHFLGTVEWGAVKVIEISGRKRAGAKFGPVECRAEVTGGYTNAIKENDVDRIFTKIGPPLSITRLEELQAMSLDLDADYEIGADIFAGDSAGWNDGAGFEPIGTERRPFTGSLKGNGFSISNLNIDRPWADFVGICGYAENAEFHDLNLLHFKIKGRDNVGGLVGRAENTGIGNVDLNNGDITGQMRVGGLLGRGGASIEECSARGQITASGGRVGGMVGELWDGSITASNTDCTVQGSTSSGGLVGSMRDSVVVNNYSHGDTTVSRESGGGLIGVANGGLISDCFSIGKVMGVRLIGGLVGYNFSSINSNPSPT